MNLLNEGLRLVLVMLFADVCSGLELDLDLENPAQGGTRQVCAVLRCVEETRTAKHAASDLGPGQPVASANNISSLTIYQTSGKSPQGDRGDTPGVVVASLTASKPRINRVSNGMKVEGVLEDGRASLTLEMVKTTDCRADFTCELVRVDSTGDESLSVARVKQGNKITRGDMGGESTLTPVSMQLLDLMHRLDAKLAIASLLTEHLESKMESKMESLEKNLKDELIRVGKSTERLETKVELLENRLEDKIDTAERNLQAYLGDKINTQIATEDTKTTRIETKLDVLKERLEDKLELTEKALHGQLASLQTRLEDKIKDDLGKKLEDVHTEVTQFTKSAESYSESARQFLNESFVELSKYLKHTQNDALTDVRSSSEQLMINQSNATEALLSAARNFTFTQRSLQEELLQTVASAVAKFSESGANSSKAITTSLSGLEQDLQWSFQRLALNVTQSASDALSSAQNMFLNSNSTAVLAIRDLLSPKYCNRGVISILADSPYSLIRPSAGSVVQVPHLCDTITDGGGWIIIQRRAHGDVDFYRDWEEYKTGFGDLRGDFWLGNDHIHNITSSGTYELRVELIYQGKAAFARYGRFSLADESNSYALTVGDYSGTAGDSMTQHNQKQFTTLDRDNDDHAENCAKICTGAWWYEKCAHSSLNGKWKALDWKGPFWYTLSIKNPVTYTEMKIRHLTNL
ncbi:hypothetical protein EGW08_023013 [Elysia chlorotica]|uniref:Fibrinogen C-terminal domain-containing protein n=1 Tax=Elysia chlorotica TaxID=188477 RepID=A0A433SJG3_ELYCH|nr:hypothetical protein EGW08_023013 [Elysia chlorotica]